MREEIGGGEVKSFLRAVFWILLVLPLHGWALNIVFGPEFTFAPENGRVPVEADIDSLERWMWNHLVKGQKAAARFSKRTLDEGDYVQFQSPNGWSFTLSSDPGVIEIQMLPMSVEMFDRFKADIQDAIFASASNIRFFPSRFTGGGHINMSCQEFKKNPLLFRNFIVDLFNHNELFMGIFGYDTNNAIPWYLKNRNDAFKEVIARFDSGRYEEDFNQFVTDLELAMNTTADRFIKYWDIRPPEAQMIEPKKRSAKGHMVNLENIITEDRFEIRAVRPQASMDVWVRQIRLFKERLEFLAKNKTAIPIEPLVRVAAIDFEGRKHHLNPPVRAEDALRAFYVYVTESGLKWQDHRDYLWPDWIENGELERFENSDWFKRRESPLKRCEANLS